jgi:hypothetical protein
MEWLKGGPFLEVSFLLEYKDDKTNAIKEIIKKVSYFNNKIEIVSSNLDEIIGNFEKGYLYNEEEPLSRRHSLFLNLYVYLPRKRKAVLHIEIVSSNSILVDFWFYGSEFDAIEWNQIGVKAEEYIDFVNFLIELFKIYEFKVGGIIYENDVTDFFELEEIFPNEGYRFENISPDFLLKPRTSTTLSVVWNQQYGTFKDIPYRYKKISHNGILVLNEDLDTVSL